jgi:hypothetical protein
MAIPMSQPGMCHCQHVCLMPGAGSDESSIAPAVAWRRAAAGTGASKGDTLPGRHAAAVAHCCGPAAPPTGRCGLARRHPYLAPLAFELAAAADAVDERDEAFGASVSWPPFRPPHADSAAARYKLDETLCRAALWRELDGAGVDLGVLSGQPFRSRGVVCWPRLGRGGPSDRTGCGISARLWHAALADCFEAGQSSLQMAAGSVLMREIARCIHRHAPPRPLAEGDLEPAWPPPLQPSLLGRDMSAADAFAVAANAAVAHFDLATRRYGAPRPPPGLPRAERKAAVREAMERAAALTPAEKARLGSHGSRHTYCSGDGEDCS